MTNKEVMQIALDVLEADKDHASYESGVCSTIEALRTALAQPEPEPEPEPVAWMHNQIVDNIITHQPSDLKRKPDAWTPLYTAPLQEKGCAECVRKQSEGWALYCVDCLREFYKHDPTNKREWVGLTDEEVSEILDAEIGFNSCFGPEEKFARAIEAKLKDKNT